MKYLGIYLPHFHMKMMNTPIQLFVLLIPLRFTSTID
jgi:hypothetical protein